MTLAEECLLPYDDSQFELGMTPWETLEDFIGEQGLTSDIRRKIVLTLVRSNLRANHRFQDASVQQWDYERPFLFATDSGEAFEGTSLDRDSGVDIALDTLHGFLSVRAFKREGPRRDAHKDPVYYHKVGTVTRRPIIQFVNGYVSALADS